jgi:hypothetical protein
LDLSFTKNKRPPKQKLREILGISYQILVKIKPKKRGKNAYKTPTHTLHRAQNRY